MSKLDELNDLIKKKKDLEAKISPDKSQFYIDNCHKNIAILDRKINPIKLIYNVLALESYLIFLDFDEISDITNVNIEDGGLLSIYSINRVNFKIITRSLRFALLENCPLVVDYCIKSGADLHNAEVIQSALIMKYEFITSKILEANSTHQLSVLKTLVTYADFDQICKALKTFDQNIIGSYTDFKIYKDAVDLNNAELLDYLLSTKTAISCKLYYYLSDVTFAPSTIFDVINKHGYDKYGYVFIVLKQMT